MGSDYDFSDEPLLDNQADLHEAPEVKVDVTGDRDARELDQALDEAYPRDAAEVGQTEVGNFDESGLTDSAEVSDYIEENIPPSHLEDLQTIDYVHDQGAYDAGLLGMWWYYPLSDESGIEIYPHDDKGEMYDTIIHEVGHNAEHVLEEQNPAAVSEWNGIYEQTLNDYYESGGEDNEFVSPYAMTSPEEDFAESYSTFVNDPDLLQFVSPQKYDFMGSKVFATARA